jgi:hypothetical protein
VSFVAFSDQLHELAIDPGLKMGEWLGEAPYAVNRLRELQLFHESPLFARWKDEVDRRRAELESGAGEPAAVPWAPKDAGTFRRALAYFVDFILVSNIVSGVNSLTTPTTVKQYGANAPPIPPTDTFDQSSRRGRRTRHDDGSITVAARNCFAKLA